MCVSYIIPAFGQLLPSALHREYWSGIFMLLFFELKTTRVLYLAYWEVCVRVCWCGVRAGAGGGCVIDGKANCVCFSSCLQAAEGAVDPSQVRKK